MLRNKRQCALAGIQNIKRNVEVLHWFDDSVSARVL